MEESDAEALQHYFPERDFVPLMEVLATVNRHTGWMEEFQHWQQRHHHGRPADRVLYAKKAGYKVIGVWKEIASGAKQERAERKKVLALAQARKVDVILVTELTRRGRSARFAARSLTCFKVRFVSSPQFR